MKTGVERQNIAYKTKFSLIKPNVVVSTPFSFDYTS